MKNIFLLVVVFFQVLCAASTLESNGGQAFEVGLHRGPAGDWPKESCVEASLENKKFSIKNSSKNYVLDRLIAKKLTEMLGEGVLPSNPPLLRVFVHYPGFGSSVFMAGDLSVCKK
ncbi:hypothetical protein [Xanthomonas sp. WHRI 7945]|nr:hypothetical protein [Xanthomonas campestris pv. campestris]